MAIKVIVELQAKPGKRAELAQLETQRAQMRHRSTLLDPRKADPDMADELVRKDLGLVRPDEVIVPLD